LRKRPGAYQHGNLAHALIAAGLVQLEARGASGLSLREVAAAVGVSPMAAYHHFRDKNALLAAIAAAGFAEFVRRQQEAVASASTPADALVLLGRCYVESAQAHPELFRLMVGQSLPRTGGGPFRAEVARAFEQCCDVVAHRYSDADRQTVRRTAAGAWALAHGLAALLVDGVMQPELLGFASVDAMVDDLLRSYWEGHGS
jgi:AcrR family transcriptional regulator